MTIDEIVEQAKQDKRYSITITLHDPEGQPAHVVAVFNTEFKDWHTLPRSKRLDLLKRQMQDVLDALAYRTAEYDGAPTCIRDEAAA